jgi:hypothetical protein
MFQRKRQEVMKMERSDDIAGKEKERERIKGKEEGR